nr:ankyrin repeat-containing domain, PGG domain, Gag-polypeptide of LTR copia-type [Tanacetum cinerariifolium]
RKSSDQWTKEVRAKAHSSMRMTVDSPRALCLFDVYARWNPITIEISARIVQFCFSVQRNKKITNCVLQQYVSLSSEGKQKDMTWTLNARLVTIEDNSTRELEHLQSTVNELDHMVSEIRAQYARFDARISKVEARMEKIEEMLFEDEPEDNLRCIS